MIHITPSSVNSVSRSNKPGKVLITVEVDAPKGAPEYPADPACSHRFELLGDDSCPLCDRYVDAQRAWHQKMQESFSNRFYTTLGVSGYSLMAQKTTRWETDNVSVEKEFNAWALSVEFPNGDLGEIFLPVRYETSFKSALGLEPPVPDIKAPKTAWDRLLEE